MSSKAHIFVVIVFYCLGKVTLSSCEVVSVNRNVTDSFLVGENGCTNNPSVCTTRSAICQPDGWCLCSSLRPTYRNPVIQVKSRKLHYGSVDGCVSNQYISAGVVSESSLTPRSSVGKRFVQNITYTLNARLLNSDNFGSDNKKQL